MEHDVGGSPPGRCRSERDPQATVLTGDQRRSAALILGQCEVARDGARQRTLAQAQLAGAVVRELDGAGLARRPLSLATEVDGVDAQTGDRFAGLGRDLYDERVL
jgi:hypothetical protein